MKMKNNVLTLLLLLATSLTFGQTEEKHPIDVQRENCHAEDSNMTTVGMTNCELIAAELWDKQINDYFNSLLTLLEKEDIEILKETQLKWIEYRDKELKFSGKFYGSLDGTMWRIHSAGRRCDINRTRALELKNYIYALTGE
jgi:uncharacterized protein YecT (DUF1311 family)